MLSLQPMWIILGNKVQTQRVPNGRRIERRCGACGEVATFYEREVNKTFRLYFVDLFNYETQRVMACGACGEHYATDELGRPLVSDSSADERQKGTVFGGVRDALRRAGNALQDATGVKPDADVGQRDELEVAPGAPPKKTIVPESKRLTAAADDDPGDDFTDPLADDDDELNRKFAALEKKLAAQRSAQKPLK
jgi:hypothetical protein